MKLMWNKNHNYKKEKWESHIFKFQRIYNSNYNGGWLTHSIGGWLTFNMQLCLRGLLQNILMRREKSYS